MPRRILNHLCSISEGIENRVDSRLEGSFDGKFHKATKNSRSSDPFSPHVSYKAGAETNNVDSGGKNQVVTDGNERVC